MSDQDGAQDAAATDDGGDGGKDWTPPTREEWEAAQNETNRLKRVSAEAAQKAKEAERAARAAADEKAKKDGDWQKVAEEKEREAADAAKRADEAAQRLAGYERERRVSDAASRLNFRDPQDAHRFLSAEEMDDDKLVDAALKRLKKDKPYLIAEPRRSGTDGDGGPDGQLPDEASPLERLTHAYSAHK